LKSMIYSLKSFLILSLFLAGVVLAGITTGGVLPEAKAHGVHLDSKEQIQAAIQGYLDLVGKLQDLGQGGSTAPIAGEPGIKLRYTNGQVFYYPQSVFSEAVYELMSRYFQDMKQACGHCDVSHAEEEFESKFQEFLHDTKERVFEVPQGFWNLISHPRKSLGRLSGYAVELGLEWGLTFVVLFSAFEILEHGLLTPVPLCTAFVVFYASTIGQTEKFCHVLRQYSLQSFPLQERIQKAAMSSLFDLRFLWRMKMAILNEDQEAYTKKSLEKLVHHEGAWFSMMAQSVFYGEVAQAYAENSQHKKNPQSLQRKQETLERDLDRILGLASLSEDVPLEDIAYLREQRVFLVFQHLGFYTFLKKSAAEIVSAAYRNDLLSYNEFFQAKLALGRLGGALGAYRNTLLALAMTEPSAAVYHQRDSLSAFSRDFTQAFSELSTALERVQKGERASSGDLDLKWQMRLLNSELKSLKKEIKEFSKGKNLTLISCEELL
jgi:hypothetical protein